MPSLRPRVCRLFVAGLCCAAVLAGCQKSLFPKNQPRTQFELHDLIHNRYTPLEQPDVFGNPQPALRARLGRRN